MNKFKADQSKQTRIGDVAASLGTTVRTLRFYEEQGLVTPYRSAQGTRRYSDENRQRLGAALSLARLGIPLADLRALAKARPESANGRQASQHVDTLLQGMQEKLTRLRDELEFQLADINQARSLVRQCFNCERPPNRDGCRHCTVGEHREQVQLLNLVWDEEHHG